jgi:hypothetical protein
MKIIQFSVFLKKKLKYKLIYMLGHVQPNIVIKALQEIDRMPLYITKNVAIKPNLQGLIEFANASGNNYLENNNFEQIFHSNNLDKSKEIIEKNCGGTLVQNILHFEQIIDDD